MKSKLLKTFLHSNSKRKKCIRHYTEMKQSSHNQFIVFVMSCEAVKPEVDYELVDYCDEVTEQIF